eukprot:c7764_g1_i1.p1 GENE.c7764_g1_i1~~c7764_g1_i1.p1  ORF type:complete len:146 (-),score=38.80 c7764_g1_i1:44-481(-)
MWDTAGQEKFRVLMPSYYRGADGVVLVFDCSNRRTFSRISVWLSDIRTHCGPNVPVILVANKCDLTEDRQVSIEEIQNASKQHSLPFMETSAKTGSGVEEVFEGIAVLAAPKIKQKPKRVIQPQLTHTASSSSGKGKGRPNDCAC